MRIVCCEYTKPPLGLGADSKRLNPTAAKAHLPLLSCFATCSMEFHEELFGYVDHMVDKVLSVPTRDGDEEWRRSRYSRKRISISKEESLESCTVRKWENSKNKSHICYNCSDNCTLWSLSTLLAQTIPYHETWHQWDAANVPLFVYRRQPLRNSHRLCYQSNAKISCWEATEQHFGRRMKGRFFEESDKDQRVQ